MAKKSTGKGISIREPSIVPPQIEKIGSIVGVPTDSDFCEKNYAAIDGLDKGKGKLFIACPTVEISSDDEDFGRLSSVLPSSLVDKQLEKVVPAPVQGDGDMGDHSLALVPALPPIKVFHPSHLFAEPYYDDLLCDDNFIMRDSPAGSQDGAGSDTFLLDLPPNEDEELKSLTENSFQSLHSDNSIVKQIEQMGVEHCSPMEHTSQPGSSKRKVEETDGETASSSLKRTRT